MLLAPFFFSVSAFAAEIIHEYKVSAVVHADGSVDITENISVTAEGHNIKHGIYRDFPLEYNDGHGGKTQIPFKLKEILVDGRKSLYKVKSMDNGLRLYIGNDKKFIYGPHTYTVKYRVARVIGFFPGGDEFYWNVTGNQWSFPIQVASILIDFPEGSKILRTVGYTGYQGSREAAYNSHVNGNDFYAYTNRPLDKNEGFSVAVSIAKGVIQPENTLLHIKYFFELNAVWLIWISFAFLSVTYLFLAWVRYGRDVIGVVVPRFEPPEGVSPDLLRYIWKQRYDKKAFTTLFVNAACNKKITIEDDGRSTILTLWRTPWSKKNIFVPHFDILSSVFAGLDSIVLPKKKFLGRSVSQEVGNKLWNAQQLHQEKLASETELYIDQNKNYVAYGIIIGVLGVLWSMFVAFDEDKNFFIVWGSAIFYALVFKLFSRIMPKYTVEGQEIVDYAAGLKMYMKTAEEERWKQLYPQNVTHENLEKLLPYALALDVEQEWCDYISSLVSDGIIPPQPDEYTASDFYYRYSFGGMHEGLESVSYSISSSSIAPGSSSAFGGGGGGSGGGGGGGGGGGW